MLCPSNSRARVSSEQASASAAQVKKPWLPWLIAAHDSVADARPCQVTVPLNNRARRVSLGDRVQHVGPEAPDCGIDVPRIAAGVSDQTEHAAPKARREPEGVAQVISTAAADEPRNAYGAIGDLNKRGGHVPSVVPASDTASNRKRQTEARVHRAATDAQPQAGRSKAGAIRSV